MEIRVELGRDALFRSVGTRSTISLAFPTSQYGNNKISYNLLLVQFSYVITELRKRRFFYPYGVSLLLIFQ